MRSTSAINFICKQSKCDKKGYAPIQMSLIINGKRTILQLPRKERPSVFKRDSVKRTTELVRYLDAVRAKVNEAQGEMMMNNITITAVTLKNFLMFGGTPSYTLEKMFSEYLMILEHRIGIDLTLKTFQKYQRTADNFMMMFGKDREASSIDSTDISRYYARLNSTEKLSTTAGKLTKIKTVFTWAKDSGKINALPFAGIKIHKPRPVIEYLNPEEIRRIYQLNTGIDRLDKVRDIFIMQCCSGLSYADIMGLTAEDIHFDNDVPFIVKKRQKTDIEFTAVLLPPFLAIFNKYNGDMPKISNQKMNAYLKEIGDLSGIKRPLVSHLGRKSYATYLSSCSVSLPSISRALGHSSVRITESTYAAKVDRTVIKEIADKCFPSSNKEDDNEKHTEITHSTFSKER